LSIGEIKSLLNCSEEDLILSLNRLIDKKIISIDINSFKYFKIGAKK